MSNTFATERVNLPENAAIGEAGNEITPFADLNLLIEDILRQVARPTAVIRCDELPVVKADKDKLRLAFLSMLRFIFRHPPVSESIFLYVKTEELRSDSFSRNLNGDTLFRVSFQTNSLAEGALFPEEESAFCRSYFSEARGTLKLNTEPGSGWIFILEVPGKLNK